MADQVRVFVSHHHSPEEDAFTARLVADLEAAGADVWVDDARITSDDFIKKINEGLTGRQWLVLVMTPDALRSPWVQAEVNAALLQVRQGRMLGVIPLVAQPCNDADIPPLWATLQYYDATRGYETARGGLLSALGLTPGRSAPPVQPAPSSYQRPARPFPASTRGAGLQRCLPKRCRGDIAADARRTCGCVSHGQRSRHRHERESRRISAALGDARRVSDRSASCNRC